MNINSTDDITVTTKTADLRGIGCYRLSDEAQSSNIILNNEDQNITGRFCNTSAIHT